MQEPCKHNPVPCTDFPSRIQISLVSPLKIRDGDWNARFWDCRDDRQYGSDGLRNKRTEMASESQPTLLLFYKARVVT